MTELESKLELIEKQVKNVEANHTVTHAQIESLVDAVDMQMKGVSKEILNLRELLETKLEAIHEQTKKTNGRVTQHDIDLRELYQKHYTCSIKELELVVDHIQKDVTRIDINTEQAQFKQKFPDLAKYMTIGSVIFFLLTVSLGIAFYVKVFGKLQPLLH